MLLSWGAIEIYFYHLQLVGRVTLKGVSGPDKTTLWRQGWARAMDLGIGSELAQVWDKFTSKLTRSHIRLGDCEDKLVWILNGAGGSYTAKLGYEVMLEPSKII